MLHMSISVKINVLCNSSVKIIPLLGKW